VDKGTLFGVLAGVVLVGGSVAMGSGIQIFFSPSSVLIVLGGTLAATTIAFPTRELKLIPPVTRRVFKNPKTEILVIMQFLMDCRKAASKEGPLALEKMAQEAPSQPLEKGLTLIADGTDAHALQEILTTEQQTMEEHHRIGQRIFSEMGKFAPAFGMIGTLIGLVQMLATLDDPSSIGPSMAVALLTTFYGALLANLFFLPMVTKLDRRIRIEGQQIELMIVGMMSINHNDSLAIMREKMKAYLADQPDNLEEILAGK
jgi:chemotaxis protein MotA